MFGLAAGLYGYSIKYLKQIKEVCQSERRVGEDPLNILQFSSTYMLIAYIIVTITQCLVFGIKVVDWYGNIAAFIEIISLGIFVVLRLAIFYMLV